MSAKDKLLTRIATLQQTLLLSQTINATAGDSPQNRTAALIRKGLGIVVFNILEDYLKERTSEMFISISSSLATFNTLPDELQEAATLGALKGLAVRASLEKKGQGDWINLIQLETLKINSTSQSNAFDISPLSLMSEASNIYDRDIPKVLKCLNIEGGWQTLQDVSLLINGGIPSLSQSFVNIASRRHKAAHVANFDYEHGWLTEAINEITAICCAFDIALSSRCRKVHNSPHIPLIKTKLQNEISCRFLLHNSINGAYQEKNALNSTRSIKNWTNYQLAVQNIVPRCIRQNQYLIVLNSQSRIIDWYCI